MDRLIQTPGPRRRLRAALLVLAVLLAHAWLSWEIAESRAGWGASDKHAIARMEVSFVRELQATEPPPAPRAAPPRRAPPAPAPAAVAVAPAASEPVIAEAAPEPPVIEPVVDPAPAVAAAEPAASDLVVAALPPSPPLPPSTDPSAPVFEWPPSTQMKYVLTGHYRGEVHGGAQVQWIRMGSRYQVHLDVNVGPSIAPLIWRRMSSDGVVTERGLKPQRYDEETRILFRSPRRLSMVFGKDDVVLANGDRHPGLPSLQDTASQFVQLTWMFTLNPELLTAGRTIDLPLALPRRVDVWTYDVLGETVLDTEIGPIKAVHIKPRRPAKPGDALTAEIWFAPTFQYLPVRIRIRQDEENYVDLTVSSRPRQTE